ncbi:MAG: Crp/Fnr family transcriptional regulator [Alphaproteobacteria bacterium]|nr:MAG: Crp/Fnr family transcriptional regulator [Alphaproteobacteria bacterium]
MMLQDGSVELLARLPLFSGVPARSLESIIYMSSRRAFGPRETLLSAGQPCHGAFFLLQGSAVQIAADGQPAGTVYRPGSLIESMAMFTATTPTHTVMASEFVLAVEITQRTMHDVLRFDPDLAVLLASRIESQLVSLEERLREIDRQLYAALPPEAEADDAGDEGARTTDQRSSEREHDQRVSPNRAPHQQPASSATPSPEQAMPTHGPAVGPDLTGASLLHDSSTR